MSKNGRGVNICVIRTKIVNILDILMGQEYLEILPPHVYSDFDGKIALLQRACAFFTENKIMYSSNKSIQIQRTLEDQENWLDFWTSKL